MPVVISSGSRAEFSIFLFQFRIVVSQRYQCGGSDRNRIRSQRQSLCDIGTIPDASGNNQLYFPVHSQILQRFDRRSNAGKRRLSDMFNKNFLRGRRAALHSVHHNHIGSGFDRKCGVVIWSRSADFNKNRFLPICDFPQFADFDFQVVRPCPIRVTTG